MGYGAFLPLVLGGATGSLHRAWRSQTQETFSPRRWFGCRLLSAKTTSDVALGAICSVGLPQIIDLVLPDDVPKLLTLHPFLQWSIAHSVAFIVSWEATLQAWIKREADLKAQGLGKGEPAIKNAASAVSLTGILPAETQAELEKKKHET